MALVPGRIKVQPEDFVVHEIPAYLPSGVGAHLYLTVEKTGRTTQEVVRELARALGVPPRDVGTAGLKDKIGVTTQLVSLPCSERDDEKEARAKELAIPGVRIVSVSRHGNKLKTGHLVGNRFELVVRDVPTVSFGDVEAAFAKLATDGVPNAYGSQRFGNEDKNVVRALAWIRGEERGPRDARDRRFLYSALQSAVFNRVLDARRQDGTWNRARAGDVLRVEESGGLFLCEDPTVDGERALRGEVSPTGPMVGPRMKAPTGEILALEDAALRDVVGDPTILEPFASYGEGTRRPLRVPVRELSVTCEKDERNPEQGGRSRVRFVLPKGAYATTVLAQVFSFETSPGPNSEGVNETELH